MSLVLTKEDELILMLKAKNSKKHARNNKLIEFRKGKTRYSICCDPIGKYTQYKQSGKWNGRMHISWRHLEA